MKWITVIALLFVFSNAIGQKGWEEFSSLTYTIKYPPTWTPRESSAIGECDLSGPTPEFNGSSENLGTSLYISMEMASFSDIDSAAIAYKKKLMGTEFLSNTVITEEKNIVFNGVEAVELHFTANLQQFSTACRIILFQRNNQYYELSVTYDQELSKKRIKEAFAVMDTFAFKK